MKFNFNNRVVMVTGGAGNLGSAVVRNYMQAGATVALVDRAQDLVDDALNEHGGVSANLRGFSGDLTDPDDVKRVVNDIVTGLGKIDVLAHTVGGYGAGDPVHEAKINIFEKMMLLNARPIFLVGGTVAKHMVDNGIEGKLVFTLARAGLKGSTNHGAYTASKAAAIRLMETMAAELKGYGIAVNGISPSTIDTPPNRDAMPDANFDKWVSPDQLAQAFMYLSSDNIGVFGTNMEVYNKA